MILNMINVGTLELSKITNLPVACIYLTHPKFPGTGISGYPSDPLLMVVTSKDGLYHAAGVGAGLEISDLMKNHNFEEFLGCSFYSTTDMQEYFESGGRITTRVMSANEAAAYPMAKTSEENLRIVNKLIRNDWPALNSIQKMPEQFRLVHQYIHEYTARSCWLYAEALSEIYPNSAAVALELGSDGISGSGHACIRHSSGMYEDIWGTQTACDIERRFNTTIKQELPLKTKLNTLNPGYATSEDFKIGVARARTIMRLNPMHCQLPQTTKTKLGRTFP